MPNLRLPAKTVDIYDEGGLILPSAVRLNFAGAGVTAVNAGGGQADATIPGGGPGGLTSINDQLANSTRQGNIAANNASGVGAIAEGGTTGATTASGADSHAEGTNTLASGTSSHAEGNNTTVTVAGPRGHAEGLSTFVSGPSAHAEGTSCTAQGPSSHAEGNATLATGDNAHAEGALGIVASGNQSHAEGTGTQATNTSAHSEGNGTRATGQSSHAEGNFCEATGSRSHAQGSSTKAKSTGSHTQGSACETHATDAEFSDSTGKQTLTALHAEHAHAAGFLFILGDSQYRRNIVNGIIVGSGELRINATGVNRRIKLVDNHTFAIKIMCVARGLTGAIVNDDAYIKVTALARMTAGVLTIIGQTPTKPHATGGAAGWTLVLSAPAGPDLAITATGTVAETAFFTAKVEMTEVG